jgi:signal peptidase I
MGNLDTIYSLLPENVVDLPSKDAAKAYAEAVQSTLTMIREKTRLFHEQLDRERRTPEPPQGEHNTFQPGDLVRIKDNRIMRTDKIAEHSWLGPYRVVSHVGNDVLCKFLFRHKEVTFHVKRVELWVGSEVDAVHAAMKDDQQYEVKKITSYTGSPLRRSEMTFRVEFVDGTIVEEREWDRDLHECQVFVDYCLSQPELAPLLFNVDIAQQKTTELRRKSIEAIKPGDIIYVKLHGYKGHDGYDWYKTQNLPDYKTTTYVLQAQVHRFSGSKTNKLSAITVKYPVLNATKEYYNDWVVYWGSTKTLSDDFVLIDDAFVMKYPQLLEGRKPPQGPHPVVVKPAKQAEVPKVEFRPRRILQRGSDEGADSSAVTLDAWGYPIKQSRKASKEL